MRRRLLLAGLATGVLLAGCGSSDTAPAPSSSTSTSTSTSTTGHGAYAACLREHGVAHPPIGPGAPPDVDPQTWAQAQEACAGEAPGPVG